jgi:hypothetical protein
MAVRARRRRIEVAIAAALLLATAVPVSGSTIAIAAPAAAAASGRGAITRLPDGWRVQLWLDDPLPVRDAAPVLAVDGHAVGAATESAGRHLLTVVTDAAAVHPGGEVTVWSPDLNGSAPNGPAARAPGTNPANPPNPAPNAVLAGTDPGTPGPYAVQISEYDLGDEAITLPGLGGLPSELRGRVYAPQGAPGARPLVLFLHGRHEPCYGDFSTSDQPWPCPEGQQPVPSYRGYDAPARALASRGYLVVSISADAINAQDFAVTDGGALARAQLVLAHLDLWRQWSTAGGGPFGDAFVGRVDLGNVGLMGHSRGGEGVVRAALLYATRAQPYGIRAVVALAPTDFTRPTIPGVATSVILPSCDGDVIDLEGQHFYDDTRYAVAGDTALRSTVLVHGANHNFFNTEWTPGLSAAPSFDDWFGDPDAAPCGVHRPSRLTPSQQQAAGRAYIAGWFEMVLGTEPALLPLFDGSGTHAASAGPALVDTTMQFPADARRDLARFDHPERAVTTAGGATARRCSGDTTFFAPPADTSLPACAAIDDVARLPHWSPAFLALGAPAPAVTRVQWRSTKGVVHVALSPGRRDLRAFDAITMRMAPDPENAGPVDLSVRLVDGKGRRATYRVSASSDALVPFTGDGFGLPKTILRTVRIPLATVTGISLADVRRVDLLTDRVAKGSVFVSDLVVSRASLGTSGPPALPRLSIADVTVNEGDRGNQVMRFRVRLSRPATRTVRVHVDAQTGAMFGVDQVSKGSASLVFAPGQTVKTLALAARGNTTFGDTVTFPVVLSIPTEAIVDRSVATGTVVEDDPAPLLRIDDATATEHDGVIRFPLRVTRPTTNGVIVVGVVSDGTAKAGSDYADDQFVAGFVDPGARHGDIEIAVLDDHVHEPTETFTIEITDVFNARLVSPSTVTGTIVDDD